MMVDDLPVVKQLPDPFLKPDGARIQKREEWSHQRKYLQELLLVNMYGHLPPVPGKISSSETSSHPLDIGAMERSVLLKMGHNDSVQAHITLTVPDGKGPFPVIISGDFNWGKVTPDIVKEVIKRGYMLAEFDRTEFAPDSADRTHGVYPAYPAYTGGAIAAWAWGYHRMVDYLLSLPNVDKSHIAITGHSRGGKAALLAGALDTRIALTAPNNSGCGGAGCSRFLYEGESIPRITEVFPFWFIPRLREFVGKINRLPVDQHTLKSLVAPRALLTTEGLGDNWANPRGTQITWQATQEVYKFLGVPANNGIFYREGGHEHGLKDWETLLDFADLQFHGKKTTRRFNELHFSPETAEFYSWSAPVTLR